MIKRLICVLAAVCAALWMCSVGFTEENMEDKELNERIQSLELEESPTSENDEVYEAPYPNTVEANAEYDEGGETPEAGSPYEAYTLEENRDDLEEAGPSQYTRETDESADTGESPSEIIIQAQESNRAEMTSLETEKAEESEDPSVSVSADIAEEALNHDTAQEAETESVDILEMEAQTDEVIDEPQKEEEKDAASDTEYEEVAYGTSNKEDELLPTEGDFRIGRVYGMYASDNKARFIWRLGISEVTEVIVKANGCPISVVLLKESGAQVKELKPKLINGEYLPLSEETKLYPGTYLIDVAPISEQMGSFTLTMEIKADERSYEDETDGQEITSLEIFEDDAVISTENDLEAQNAEAELQIDGSTEIDAPNYEDKTAFESDTTENEASTEGDLSESEIAPEEPTEDANASNEEANEALRETEIPDEDTNGQSQQAGLEKKEPENDEATFEALEGDSKEGLFAAHDEDASDEPAGEAGLDELNQANESEETIDLDISEEIQLSPDSEQIDLDAATEIYPAETDALVSRHEAESDTEEDITEECTSETTSAETDMPEEYAFELQTEESDEETVNEEQTPNPEGTADEDVQEKEGHAWVSASFAGGKDETSEREVILTAHVEGVTAQYVLQWQYSPDGGKTVIDIDGANESEYHYILNETNAAYLWRVRINIVSEDE